jgi:hypothetical protein
MWIHKVAGALLALAASVVVWWMGAVLYGGADPGLRTTVQIGIPGAILIAAAAGCALACGLSMLRAPRAAGRDLKRLRIAGSRHRR